MWQVIFLIIYIVSWVKIGIWAWNYVNPNEFFQFLGFLLLQKIVFGIISVIISLIQAWILDQTK